MTRTYDATAARAAAYAARDAAYEAAEAVYDSADAVYNAAIDAAQVEYAIAIDAILDNATATFAADDE